MELKAGGSLLRLKAKTLGLSAAPWCPFDETCARTDTFAALLADKVERGEIWAHQPESAAPVAEAVAPPVQLFSNLMRAR